MHSRNGAPPAARPAAITPANHLLGQVQLLLRAAHAIHIGACRRGWPLRLDQAQRGRLALSLVTVAGLAELQASPGNLPTGQSTDPQLYGRMEHATIRLHQARMHLETLTARAEPDPAHSVLTAVADAADAMDSAWELTQEAGGLHLQQVDRANAQLGHVIRSLANIAQAVAEQEEDQRWKPAAGLLATASHALHDIRSHVVDRP